MKRFLNALPSLWLGQARRPQNASVGVGLQGLELVRAVQGGGGDGMAAGRRRFGLARVHPLVTGLDVVSHLQNQILEEENVSREINFWT